jgi:hypothetical protein
MGILPPERSYVYLQCHHYKRFHLFATKWRSYVLPNNKFVELSDRILMLSDFNPDISGKALIAVSYHHVTHSYDLILDPRNLFSELAPETGKIIDQ